MGIASRHRLLLDLQRSVCRFKGASLHEFQVHVAVAGIGRKALAAPRFCWTGALLRMAKLSSLASVRVTRPLPAVRFRPYSAPRARHSAHHAGVGGGAIKVGRRSVVQLDVTVLGLCGNAQSRGVGQADAAVPGGSGKGLGEQVVYLHFAVVGRGVQVIKTAAR